MHIQQREGEALPIVLYMAISIKSTSIHSCMGYSLWLLLASVYRSGKPTVLYQHCPYRSVDQGGQAVFQDCDAQKTCCDQSGQPAFQTFSQQRACLDESGQSTYRISVLGINFHLSFFFCAVNSLSLENLICTFTDHIQLFC